MLLRIYNPGLSFMGFRRRRVSCKGIYPHRTVEGFSCYFLGLKRYLVTSINNPITLAVVVVNSVMITLSE